MGVPTSRRRGFDLGSIRRIDPIPRSRLSLAFHGLNDLSPFHHPPPPSAIDHRVQPFLVDTPSAQNLEIPRLDRRHPSHWISSERLIPPGQMDIIQRRRPSLNSFPSHIREYLRLMGNLPRILPPSLTRLSAGAP